MFLVVLAVGQEQSLTLMSRVSITTTKGKKLMVALAFILNRIFFHKKPFFSHKLLQI